MIKQKNETMTKSQKGLTTINSVKNKNAENVSNPTIFPEATIESDKLKTAEQFAAPREVLQKKQVHEQIFNMSMNSAMNKSHNEKLKQSSLKYSITPKRESKKAM